MNMSTPPPKTPMSMASTPPSKQRYLHMTFFWGKKTEVLFTGWPGARSDHYALALIVCFFFAFIAEWLSFCRITRPGWSRSAISLTRTSLYTVRLGLMYLIMLALMSFNGGIFIAFVAGHAAGFALFEFSKKKDYEFRRRDNCPGIN